MKAFLKHVTQGYAVLMEEIPINHQGCLQKTYRKQWDKLPTSTSTGFLARFLNHQQYLDNLDKRRNRRDSRFISCHDAWNVTFQTRLIKIHMHRNPKRINMIFWDEILKHHIKMNSNSTCNCTKKYRSQTQLSTSQVPAQTAEWPGYGWEAEGIKMELIQTRDAYFLLKQNWNLPRKKQPIPK